IVTWGSDTTVGITPAGKPTGLQHNDMGKQRVQDVSQTFATGAYYWAWVDHYKWELGLAVRDWRYNVRIANIDVSDLSTVNAANIINALVRGLNRPDDFRHACSDDDLRRAVDSGRHGPHGYLLQPNGPDLPRTPGDEQDQRALGPLRVQRQGHHHLPRHPDQKRRCHSQH